MFRFLHAADIHLDSPLKGLQRYPGAPVERLRNATRRALENLVGLALEEEVDLVLLAGDLYDGDWKDYHTGLFFNHQMARLKEAGIPVVSIAGNHDAASRITRSLRLPDNVTVLSTRQPETKRFEFEDLEVAVHGQGYARPEETRNLAAGYPQALPGCFNVGLLHTACDGREGHAPYAPCTVDDLRATGYDYWALGHVHRREILCRQPFIAFPGNLQGRHARETGPRGCLLATLDECLEVEFRPLDVVRWEKLEVDASGARNGAEVLERLAGALGRCRRQAGDRVLALRVEVYGACPAHGALARTPEHWVNQVRALATELGEEEIWVEEVGFRTRPEVDLDHLQEGDDAFAGLLRSVRTLRSDPEGLRSLAEELFRDLAASLPPELQQGEEPLNVRDPEVLRAALEDVENLLAAHLQAAVEEAG